MFEKRIISMTGEKKVDIQCPYCMLCRHGDLQADWKTWLKKQSLFLFQCVERAALAMMIFTHNSHNPFNFHMSFYIVLICNVSFQLLNKKLQISFHKFLANKIKNNNMIKRTSQQLKKNE